MSPRPEGATRTAAPAPARVDMAAEQGRRGAPSPGRSWAGPPSAEPARRRGTRGTRMEVLRLALRGGGLGARGEEDPAPALGALEFSGEGSCQTEDERNKAEAVGKRGAPPLRHSVGMGGAPAPPLPLRPPALVCFRPCGPARPCGSLGTKSWAVAPLG